MYLRTYLLSLLLVSCTHTVSKESVEACVKPAELQQWQYFNDRQAAINIRYEQCLVLFSNDRETCTDLHTIDSSQNRRTLEADISHVKEACAQKG